MATAALAEIERRESPMPPMRPNGDIREILPKIEGREINPIKHLGIICGGGDMEESYFDAATVLGIPEITLVYTTETAAQSGFRKAKAMAESGINVHLAFLGSGEPRTTVANEELVIAILKEYGVDTACPGYSTLAENAHFVGRLEEEGIRFTGPTSKAIHELGDKAELKMLANNLNIKTIPGSPALNTIEEALDWGSQLGLIRASDQVPKQDRKSCLIKMSGEGGGRGIFEVSTLEDVKGFFEELKQSQDRAREKQGHNGLGEIILEKKIDPARHVEIQMVGDGYGSTLALGERECTEQTEEREKLAEISPPRPGTVTKEKLRQMRADAAKLMRATNYKGLATVEFIVDENGNPYLMEVNTRIQVEHALNEIRNGFNYKQLQLALEEGFGLPLVIHEADIVVMQVREYARDAIIDAKTHGPINETFPPDGPNTRTDTAFGKSSDNDDLPPFYIYPTFNDLVAKHIAAGRTLKECIAVQTRALDNTYQSPGSVATNRPFLRWLINDPRYLKGEFTTTSVTPAWKEELERKKRAAKRLVDGTDTLREGQRVQRFHDFSIFKETDGQVATRDADVFVFRHGEDGAPQLRLGMTYEEFREYIYHQDSPLTENGKRQLEESLDKINDAALAGVTGIVTSNIRRARESAMVIRDYIQRRTGRDLPIPAESSLIAETTITADVLPEEEYSRILAENDGDPSIAVATVLERWLQGHPLLQETHKATTDLIRNFLHKLGGELKPHEKIIAVTHGFVSRTMQYLLRGGRINDDGRFDYDLLRQTPALDNGEFLALKYHRK